jgi:hypothetical protein
LKPNSPPDPNELTPAAGAQTTAAGNQPLPPPVQVNELQAGSAASGSVTAGSTSASAESSTNLASDQDISSSKKKKKKGLKKIISF